MNNQLSQDRTNNRLRTKCVNNLELKTKQINLFSAH